MLVQGIVQRGELPPSDPLESRTALLDGGAQAEKLHRKCVCHGGSD